MRRIREFQVLESGPLRGWGGRQLLWAAEALRKSGEMEVDTHTSGGSQPERRQHGRAGGRDLGNHLQKCGNESMDSQREGSVQKRASRSGFGRSQRFRGNHAPFCRKAERWCWGGRQVEAACLIRSSCRRSRVPRWEEPGMCEGKWTSETARMDGGRGETDGGWLFAYPETKPLYPHQKVSFYP